MRRMIGWSLVLGLATAAAVTTGCGTTVGDDGNGGAGGSDCPSYSGEVASIIKTYCVTCHVAGGQEADKPFDTYAGIEAHSSEAQEEVESGKMPPQGATAIPDAARKKLVAWLACGAPEN
ncbi:Hypothetical protein A7982_08747 [Minicystis rosea]|nr:Hypothetical protein A7982_08747 [Minicystis rosea]